MPSAVSFDSCQQQNPPGERRACGHAPSMLDRRAQARNMHWQPSPEETFDKRTESKLGECSNWARPVETKQTHRKELANNNAHCRLQALERSSSKTHQFVTQHCRVAVSPLRWFFCHRFLFIWWCLDICGSRHRCTTGDTNARSMKPIVMSIAEETIMQFAKGASEVQAWQHSSKIIMDANADTALHPKKLIPALTLITSLASGWD